MRIKTYHGLTRMRRAIEQEMRRAEERSGSGNPETQQLYRIAAHMRRAELECVDPGQARPVYPPSIIRMHWRNDAA